MLLSIGHFLKVSLCEPAFLKGFGLLCFIVAQFWLRGLDLNQRPSGYEPDELPAAPPRDIIGAEDRNRTGTVC